MPDSQEAVEEELPWRSPSFSPFWNLGELAQVMGLKLDTLRRHCVARRIPGAKRVGGRWLVHRRTFEKFFRDAVPRWKEEKPPRRRLRDILG